MLFRSKLEQVSTPNISEKTVTVSYNIITLTEQEYISRIKGLESQIRIIRDNYLKLTDFTQLADSPITAEAKEDYRIFRQQLRDILNNVTDPSKVVWPPIPTSAPNIEIPLFSPVPSYKNGIMPPF